MAQVEEVTDIRSLETYLSEWRRLVDSCDDARLLDTPEWLTSSLRHFWPDRRLAFLFIREGGSLSAVLPLIEDECRGCLHRSALALPVHNQVRRANLVTALDPRTTLRSILSHLLAAHRGACITAQVSADTHIARTLPELALECGLATTVRPSTASPFALLPASWEEYLAGREGHVRSELRRKRKRIERERGFEARTISREEEVEEGMADVFAIESNSWKATRGEAMTATEELRRFFEDLARVFSARGWLRLHLLYVGGAPVAHLFGVAYKDELSALKTSYDDSFRRLSPGIVVATEAIKSAIEEGLRAFDLLGADARWKSELATGERKQACYCFYPKGTVLCRACGIYHRHAKPLIKRHLPVLTALRKLVS